ncbi:MAG: PKD domain-containing protein, partial [Methanomassiliicoccales archaeon]
MEGSEKKALPKDNAPKKAGMNKMIALIIVIILVVAAIVGALVLTASKPNNSPTVRVTISSTLISAGQPVTYNASTTTDPEGDILKFTWNFGDAMQDTTSGAVATHVYSFPGIYFMMLIVDDQHGNTANNLATPLKLEVVNPVVAPSNTSKPIALVAASANNIAAGTTVTFNGNGSAGFAQGRDGPIGPSIANVSDLQWIWGDDTPSAHGTPAAVGIYNHTFAVGKNVVYPAKLIVTGENGQTQTYYYNIIVGAGSSGNVKNPDKFIMATIGEPDYLDPAVDYETAGGEICQNVYETLVWYDGNSAATLKPLLATSVPTVANGGIAIDGLTYT